MDNYDFDKKGFAVKEDEKGNTGYINQNFDWIIPSIYSHVLKPFGEHDYSTVLFNLTNEKHVFELACGIIDRTGKWVVYPDYDALYYYSDTNIVALKNGLYGILDIKGNWIITPTFEQITAFDSNNIAIANFSGKWGVLNRKSEWIIDAQYDEIENYFDFEGKEINVRDHFDTNQHIKIKKDGKWGIIDINNNCILEPVFSYIFPFCNERNTAKIANDGKFGIIDRIGNILIEPIYNSIIDYYDRNYFFVQTVNLKWGLFDNNGKQLFYPMYDDLKFIEKDKLFKATIGNKYGFIDIEENWIIQPTLDVEVLEDEVYPIIKDYIKNIFKTDKVNGLHCLEDIAPNLIKSFNQNFDIGFTKNMEYLFFCDESFDLDYTCGLAMVKKENDYFLLWKGFKHNSLVFSMSSGLTRNQISEVNSDNENCEIRIISNLDGVYTSNKIHCYNILFMNNFEWFYRN
jgi:hypothetical protein